MNKISLTALLLACMALASCDQLDCKKFRNGRFLSVMPGVGTDTVYRQGNMQIEHMAGRPADTLRVKWIDDCTYQLTPAGNAAKRQSLPANAVVTVSITKTTDTSYFQTSKANFSDKQFHTEMILSK